MALLNDIHSIVVSAGSANFSAHSYTEVYAGVAATPTINGVAVAMGAGSSIKIKVRSISPTANVYLLGENINCALGSQYLGGYGA
jgi:hypothetical protein